MSLKLNSSGGGSVTLQEPVTASNVTLNLPATAGTVVAADGSGNVSVTSLTVNGNNISAVNSLGFRNRIINGNMVIDQRNAGASVTPASGQYLVDRFKGEHTAASKFSGQRVTTAPAGFSNSLLLTSLSAYSVGSSDVFQVVQVVEGFNIADFGWGTANAQAATLSFWVRSSLTGTFGGVVIAGGGGYNLPVSYTISSANTWEYKTVSIPAPTTGSFGTSNDAGAIVLWSLGCGSTLLGTPGAWTASTIRGVTGQVNLVGTNGATFYITGVQLEAGSVATPFEQIDYGRELAMCQRYCQLSGNATGQAFSTSRLSLNYALPVTMRVDPSVTYVNGSSGLIRFGGSTESFTSLDVAYVTRPNFVGANLNGSGYGVGSIYMAATSGALIFSAEL